MTFFFLTLGKHNAKINCEKMWKNDILKGIIMDKENAEEIKKSKNRKKRAQSASKITVRIIAALMIVSMVFAVAATCIFYLQYNI